MIDPSKIILLKSIFWYLNKHPETAHIGSDKITDEALDTVLTREPITLWIPVTPPNGKDQNLNVLEVRFPASTADPLTVRGLLHYLYKHYNLTRVAVQHRHHIPEHYATKDSVRYVDIMEKSILFMGLQYIKKHKIYNVMFLQSALP